MAQAGGAAAVESVGYKGGSPLGIGRCRLTTEPSSDTGVLQVSRPGRITGKKAMRAAGCSARACCRLRTSVSLSPGEPVEHFGELHAGTLWRWDETVLDTRTACGFISKRSI